MATIQQYVFYSLASLLLITSIIFIIILNKKGSSPKTLVQTQLGICQTSDCCGNKCNLNNGDPTQDATKTCAEWFAIAAHQARYPEPMQEAVNSLWYNQMEEHLLRPGASGCPGMCPDPNTMNCCHGAPAPCGKS